jgi:hypothetical protein
MVPDAGRVPRFASLAAGLCALLGSIAAWPSPARAQETTATAPAAATLTAERARLRTELDRVNAEIDAYKRAGGVGDDYRLRARLADAESLARRLMDIDARLGLRAGGAAAAGKPLAPPVAAPTDAPADLDAKADILADQVRRLRAQADSFGTRARQIKARQELRRRAGELERDPFGPMEASKRRVASGPGTTAGLGGVTQTSGSDTRSQSQVPVFGGNTGVGPAVTTPGPAGQTSPGVTGTLPGPAPMAAAGQEAALSVQLRDLVDTATLADLRRLEGRAVGSSPQALERAATALRARAGELDARARAMRTQAHPHP